MRPTTSAGLGFALSVQLWRDPQDGALQVPRVPPRATWPELAYRPAPTRWQSVSAPAPAPQPALVALGALQHWLRTSPTGSPEEQEASAYWAVCRTQEAQEGELRARLRHGEHVHIADLRPDDSPWAQPGIDGALASAAEGLRGARLVLEALRTWRGEGERAALTPQASGVAAPRAADAACEPPAQIYARCLQELIDAAERRPELLLPTPGTRRELGVELRLDAPPTAATRRPDALPEGWPHASAAPRYSLTLTSAVPDQPGPATAWTLRQL